MTLVFSIVLSAALQAGVVGLVLLLARWVLRRWLPTKWICLLWMVLLCKLIVPFGPESAVSLFNAAPESVRQAVSVVTVVPQEMETAEAIPFAERTDWREIGAWIWVSGCAILLLWLLATRLLLAVRMQCTGKPADMRIARLLDGCRIRLSVPQTVSVVVQNGVAAPSLLGLVRPKILLPAYVQDMPDRSISYILLHELSHIKRCDQWLNTLLLVLRTIFWFQPLVWLCFHLLRQDMELATDERVLQSIGTDQRVAYGESLLDTLHRISAPAMSPRLLGLVSGRKSLKERLKRIARFRQTSLLCTAAGMILVAALSSVCLTSAKTLLPAPVVEVLSPTLPPIAAVAEPQQPETNLPEREQAQTSVEQPAEQPEILEPAEQPAPEADQPAVQLSAAPDTASEKRTLPEQTVKATAPSEGITSQAFDLLPGTDINVLEQYAQMEGRTAGTDGSNLADRYYKGSYTLNEQTPSADVTVAADENGAVTYLVENNLNVDLPVQVIDPETQRRLYQSFSIGSGRQWAESVTGLVPGKTYILRLQYPSEATAACTGTILVY